MPAPTTMVGAMIENSRAEGRTEGRAEGIAIARESMCRQAARQFDPATANRLAELLNTIDDQERLARIGDAIVDCGSPEEFIARCQSEVS